MKWQAIRRQLPFILLAAAVIFGARLFFRSGNFGSLETDTSRAVIPTSGLMSGGPPPQGIPALGFEGAFNGSVAASPAPQFVRVPEAASWLGALEPVIAVAVAGEVRAYPLQILMWHEIANDAVGGVPLAVTFCPLCNSAFAFDRRIPLTREQREVVGEKNPQAHFVPLDDDFLAAYREQEGAETAGGLVTGLLVTFGTSGMLYNSNLVMVDSQTSTLWPQVLAGGGVGTLAGVKLLRHPAQIISFTAFREAYPEGLVLSRRTGFNRQYGRNPYSGYDRVDSAPFLFRGRSDNRLLPKLRVVTFELNGEAVAYPFDVLERLRVVNDEVGGVPVVVMWQPGTNSALDSGAIAGGRDVGAVGMFRRRLGGRLLRFAWDGASFVDEQTAGRWDLLGRALAGELAGARLEPVVHDNTLWFAWAAFKPETRVFRSE